jgi:hypothetical protein
MQSIDTHFLSQISGGRDRSFTAGFIPGGQGVALIGGTLGMIGFALDKQFCE